MEKEYFAHIDDAGNTQTVAEHCRATARYASEALYPVGLSCTGYLSGLLHDCGKYTEAFQVYLKEENGRRGSVIHSFQGCRLLLDQFHQAGAPRYEDLSCELLAYAIGGHHGLFDCIDDRGKSGFSRRQSAADIGYEEVKVHFLQDCADEAKIERIFLQANTELSPLYNQLSDMSEDDHELSFYIGLLARLILSSVIDGDRHDTAKFMNGTSFPAPMDSPPRVFWRKYLEHMEKKLGGFSQETEIERARSRISLQCRRAAENPCGIYRLNVPTGAGKTLASLRFALAHAAKWEKQRIIFTAPLLTILEQNAAVLRDFIGDDSIVLEHHSNVVHTKESDDTLDRNELLTENWRAPVIITSMVQLLNTMFSGKTTCIRRFQAMCNSVIVIDEVQTVPGNMLTLFNLAVNFLSTVCGVTFVLCSATQPCLEEAQHPLQKSVVDIVPYDATLWNVFHRTMITDAGPKRLEEIPIFLKERLEEVNNLLVVCNKKRESETLFSALSSPGIRCFHLSAAMCMAHRRDVLSAVESALVDSRTGREKVVLVSTQVIEAGVDISFDCVVRLQAGMDSVVQSAGRCNRHGEIPYPVPVYIVQCSDESLTMLHEIQQAKDATGALLEDFHRHPERYHHDLSSETAVHCYYRALYRRMEETKGYQDFPTPDKNTLFSLLSENDHYANEEMESNGVYYLRQAFKKAGELFRVFDDSTEDAVVPYGEGEALIQELNSMGSNPPTDKLSSWLERARPYTISIYQYQKEKLGPGIVEQFGISYLHKMCYDEHTGLITNKEATGFWEVR